MALAGKVRWTSRVLRYLGHVVDRFDLRRDILFGAKVTAAEWRERARRWVVTTDTGKRFACRYFVLATGALSGAEGAGLSGRGRFSRTLLPDFLLASRSD